MNILYLEVIVLITFGWIATLYQWRRQWIRQQQAWQWWHEQQAQQSHHSAESIRDGLLQQTFAFRRYLESIGKRSGSHSQTTALTSPNAEQNDRWLSRVQSFHQSLETLSDELSPPFVADSLPLALQFAIKSWQHNANITAPPDWPYGSPQQNQTILSVTTALLTLLSSKPEMHKNATPISDDIKALYVTLSHTEALNTLEIKIDCDPAKSVPNFRELIETQYLKEIFHSLLAGQLEIRQEASAVIGYLHWPSATALHERNQLYRLFLQN